MTCPDCGATAEPEADGDLQFYSCSDCGREWGYRRVPAPTYQSGEDGTCAIGVPVEMRKAFSETVTGVPVEITPTPGAHP